MKENIVEYLSDSLLWTIDFCWPAPVISDLELHIQIAYKFSLQAWDYTAWLNGMGEQFGMD